jgi:hypothetical protein
VVVDHAESLECVIDGVDDDRVLGAFLGAGQEPLS